VITVTEVSELIIKKLRNKLPAGVSGLTEQTDLRDLGLSSLQISDIVFTLEERHNFEFDAARAADARTIGEIVALANETLAKV
jgi:acyl carrier protein